MANCCYADAVQGSFTAAPIEPNWRRCLVAAPVVFQGYVTQAAWGFLVIWSAFIPMTGASAQGSAEIVRGRVTDSGQQPVVNATVTVTGGGTQSVRTTHTDNDGRYTALFLDGETNYVLLVRQVGYTPAIRRVSRAGASSIVLADVVLIANAYPLEPLTVTAPRVGPRNRTERGPIGGLEQSALVGADFYSIQPILTRSPSLFRAYSRSAIAVIQYWGLIGQNNTMLDRMKYDGGQPTAGCDMG